MFQQYPVIDSDGHVSPRINWEAKVPEPFKKWAPRRLDFDTGGPRTLVEGKINPKPYGKGRSLPGEQANSYKGTGGVTDPQARLRDMDEEGIDVAIIYGGSTGPGLAGLDSPELAAVLCRVYNDWLAEYCSVSPKRLKGIAAIPAKDPKAAVREMDRAVTKLGFAGVVLPPNLNGKNVDHPDFWPIYEEAERLGVPMAFHHLTGLYGVEQAGADRFDNAFFTHAISHPFEICLGVISIVCNGIMDRFPRLKFVFLEAGCGWLPFWMDRLDEHYEILPHLVPIQRKPSEYIRSENFYISCEPDEHSLRFVLDVVGEDRVVYASDYPHWDAQYPNSVKAIAERPELTDAQKRKVLSENTARAYGMKAPATR